MSRFSCFFLLLAFLALGVLGQNGPADQNKTGLAGTFAITNATIYTVSGTVIEKGTVVISNGKIAAVGTNAAVPSGALEIDGTGMNVYPGMIDAGTAMGLLEIGNGVEGTVDNAETGNINANAQAILAINPHTSHINVTRVNGITTVLSRPASGLISGQSAIINLNGATQSEMEFVSHFALVINFPEISTFAGFTPGVGPRLIDFAAAVKRRDNRLKDLKEVFHAAKRYGEVRDAYAKDPSLPVPDTDLKMAAMVPYVRGEKPILFNVQRARDIKGLIAFADEMKIKAIILGGREAWKVGDELSKASIPVIYTEIHSNPSVEDDPYDVLFEAPSLMKKAGVSFCISTGDNGAAVRELPYQAGLASAFGLSKDDALKSVTLYPAQILGIADRVGSIEAGKDANIVVTKGDILEATTNVEHLFIGGRKIPLTSRHTEFFEAFKDRKLP
ncbi:MAG: amidohydrolase family protein [Acidobacteriota bacterium]|nr:amidohydrolase family protein [Acidobacteriota bacterium]MDH3530609.1 amidohydrolase family protein [Acidobacteriota bacterium]